MSTEQVLQNSLSPEVTHDHPPAVPFRGRIIRTAGSDAVLYPRWFYIRDRLGRYLTIRQSPSRADGNLTFRSGEPDLDCTFEAIPAYYPSYRNFRDISGSYVSLEHDYPNNWDYFYMDPYSVHAAQIDTVTGAGESKVYLKTFPGSLIMSNQLTQAGSPFARNFSNLDSEMEIITAAMKNEIFDVEYDIPGAEVREASPLIALRTSVRNDSAGDVNQTLSYTYEKWAVGTWNNALGVELGGKMTFKAGVPFIASAEWEIVISGSYLHEWGGEEGLRQVITSSTTVTVPPKKKAHASIIVRNAQIDVGFTYIHRTVWSNGKSEDQRKTGVYNNVDSWQVDVVLDDWEDV